MHRALVTSYLAGLALCPLWYASTPLLAGCGNAIAFGALVALLSWRRLAARIAAGPAAPIGLAAVLYLAALAWALFQANRSVPVSAWHPSWPVGAAALEQPLDGAVSVNPRATLIGAMRLATCACVFWCALQIGRDARVARMIVMAVAVSAACCSLYGLVDFFVGWNQVLWAPKDAFVIENNGGYVSGTFINRGHFAAYCGLGLIASGGLFIRDVGHALDAHASSRRRSFALAASRLATRGATTLALAVPTGAALLLSQSRSGIASVAAGLVVLMLLHVRRASWTVAATATAVAATAGLALLASPFADAMIARTLGQADPFSGRARVYAIALRAIEDRPWLGHGYGTFADVFPLYRDGSAGYGGIWNAAHNSYLELALGLGLPAAGALLASIAASAWRCAAAARYRRRARLAPIVAVSASVALALHSAIDFPLQTDAVAIAFAALLGAGVAQSRSSQALPARPGSAGSAPNAPRPGAQGAWRV